MEEDLQLFYALELVIIAAGLFGVLGWVCDKLEKLTQRRKP